MQQMPQGLYNKIIISQESVPIRLDKAIAAGYATYSRTKIQKLIANGNISVSGKIVTDCAYQVKCPAVIELRIPKNILKVQPISYVLQPLNVMFEDSDIIVIDKPHSIAVHPSSLESNQKTLVDVLKSHCGDNLSDVGGDLRPGIVHRLDANTSGLMIIAKNNRAHNILAGAFATKQIERIYLALVYGVPSVLNGTISGNIERSKKDRTKMTIVQGRGRFAKTHYRTIHTYYDTISLLECRLETGRTHQIRIHMSSKNHPIVGDKAYMMSRNYNISKLPKDAADAIKNMNRQALHSAKLSFTHPITLEELNFESNVPDDIRYILDVIG